MNEEVLKVLKELLSEVKETKAEVKKMNSNFKQINKQLKNMSKDSREMKESLLVVEENVADLTFIIDMIINAAATAGDGMIEYDEFMNESEDDSDLEDGFPPLFDKDFKL